MSAKRNYFDLTHYGATVGKLGRLQTLSVIPVLPNDSISLNITCAFRQSPLRRVISMDCNIGLYAFYVPHRHIYNEIPQPDNPDSETRWLNFIKRKVSTARPGLTTVTVSDYDTNVVGYTPCRANKMPLHYVDGYNEIWNEYFRVPSCEEDPGEVVKGQVLPVGDARTYGARIARLPNFWTTQDSKTEKYNVPIDNGWNHLGQNQLVGVSSSSAFNPGGHHGFNISDFSLAQATTKDDLTRSFFAERYRDVMSTIFGTGKINTDADQRPTLIASSNTWMSGYDVDGTADANLGNYTGKAQALAQLECDSKYFAEHGSLHIMAALRYPSITANEQHAEIAFHGGHIPGNLAQEYGTTAETINTSAQQQSLYNLITGDPNFSDVQGLVATSQNVYFDNFRSFTNSDLVTQQPYNQWFRTHPSSIHPRFKETDAQGYPFIDMNDFPATGGFEEFVYDGDDRLADIYESTELAHWNCVSKIGVSAKRNLTSTVPQLYASTRGVS